MHRYMSIMEPGRAILTVCGSGGSRQKGNGGAKILSAKREQLNLHEARKM